MIRVASYNIQKSIGTDFRRRPERILEVLVELDADVVALQEVDRRFGERVTSLPPEAIAAVTGYEPIVFGARPQSLGWHGNTLLVRRGVEVLARRQLVLPRLEPRGGVLADLNIRGEKLRVVGLHLGLLGLWRKRQAEAVLRLIEALETPMPTVIMGDLNEWRPSGPRLRRLHERFSDCAAPRSFHARLPTLRLDRIFVSERLRLVDFEVVRTALTRRASDHLPVRATIAVGPQPVLAAAS